MIKTKIRQAYYTDKFVKFVQIYKNSTVWKTLSKKNVSSYLVIKPFVRNTYHINHHGNSSNSLGNSSKLKIVKKKEKIGIKLSPEIHLW